MNTDASMELKAAFHLPPALNSVLTLLMAVPILTPELIEEHVELNYNYRVAMHRLRAALAPYGIEIRSRRMTGYWLEEEDREKIKQRVRAALRAVA